MKLVYWLLGFLGSSVVGLGGFVTEHVLSDSTAFSARLAALEVQSAAVSVTTVQNADTIKRLEDKMDRFLEAARNRDQGK